MKPVNPYFLHTLLEPITGLADVDDAVTRYALPNPHDERDARGVIRVLSRPSLPFVRQIL
jgi:hypothetical protein